jgi:ATP phosphoribosyltransferase
MESKYTSLQEELEDLKKSQLIRIDEVTREKDLLMKKEQKESDDKIRLLQSDIRGYLEAISKYKEKKHSLDKTITEMTVEMKHLEEKKMELSQTETKYANMIEEL